MEFLKIIELVGQRLGLENFAPDEEGLCELITDDTTISIQYLEEKELVFIYAPVIEIPDTCGPVPLRKICEANFMFIKTRGMTLSISPETSMLVIAKTVQTAGLDDDKFFELLERFCSVFQVLLERATEILAKDAQGSTDNGHLTQDETRELQGPFDGIRNPPPNNLFVMPV